MKEEQARQMRYILEKMAAGLTDNDAVRSATYVQRWKPGIYYETGERVSVVDGDNIIVYKCVQPHASQQLYKPGAGTESLWMRLDVEHTGTIKDPIPWEGNMECAEGRYYTCSETLYKCIRDSGAALSYTPDQLIGQYFETV